MGNGRIKGILMSKDINTLLFASNIVIMSNSGNELHVSAHKLNKYVNMGWKLLTGKQKTATFCRQELGRSKTLINSKIVPQMLIITIFKPTKVQKLTLWYGSENWSMNTKCKTRITATKMRLIRQVVKYAWTNYKRNEYLLEELK